MRGMASAVVDWFGFCARMALCVSLLTSGCLIEEGNAACSKGQIEVDEEGAHYCLCAPDSVIDDDGVGCKACGENEQAQRDECVCREGYVRTGGVCSASSLGAPCTSSDGCASDFPICVIDDAGGYCSSQGCTSSSDCQPTWFCETATCKKPPPGYRQACESPADCAGTAATFCDSFQTHSCLIEGCGAGAPCPGDWSCCRIELLGVSLCVEPAGLTSGACPAGGRLVPP